MLTVLTLIYLQYLTLILIKSNDQALNY